MNFVLTETRFGEMMEVIPHSKDDDITYTENSFHGAEHKALEMLAVDHAMMEIGIEGEADGVAE